MKKLCFLNACIFFSLSSLMAQSPATLKTNDSNVYNDGTNIGIGTTKPTAKLSTLGTIDFKRTAADGLNYELNMSDSLPSINSMAIPHIALFVGHPIGLHSVMSLENAAICCGQDSLTAVMGVLDNSGPFHNIIRMTQTDFYMRATDINSVSGLYHISNSGISFTYRDAVTSTDWLLSNRAGKPGQVLTLNSTADTAQWKNINTFANISRSAPENGGLVTVKPGTNIIEPAAPLASLNIQLPVNPVNGDIIELSFVKPVTAITYKGGILANATTSASAGSTDKYIYYADTGKWYNW